MKFNVTMDRDEDGVWIIECPSIPGCISQGATKEEALENIQDAISEAYTEAVDRASSEVEEGRYEPHELAKLVNRQEICDRAMILISTNLEI